MKLFHKYNRVNLSFLLLIFVLSGVLYYVMVRYVLIHELDEALSDYKHRIESYEVTHTELPQRCMLDETLIDYTAMAPGLAERYYFIRRFDSSENKSHEYRQLEYSQKTGKGYFKITIAKELEGTKMLTHLMLYATLGLILLIIIISALINIVLLKRLWRPFYNTISQLNNFKLGGKGGIHFEETNIDEFTFLNENVRSTMERANKEYKTLKEFTENAAHEMQTPVSIIRSKLDLMIQQEGLSEKQTDAIKSTYQGIQRLNKLNQSLLLLAKIENQQFLDRQSIELDVKVKEKMEQFQDIFDSMNLKAHFHTEPLTVIINEALVDILLNNMLSNAARHNYAGGDIFIKLNGVTLSIANTGKHAGLAIDTMFVRFSKGDPSSHHNGLGLSIIKEICDQSKIAISYYFEHGLHTFVFDFEQIK